MLLSDDLREALTVGPLETRVALLNQLRQEISALSPFAAEPVDCVQWVQGEEVSANDYNPNSVAPPEMELLRLSIMADVSDTKTDAQGNLTRTTWCRSCWKEIAVTKLHDDRPKP